MTLRPAGSHSRTSLSGLAQTVVSTLRGREEGVQAAADSRPRAIVAALVKASSGVVDNERVSVHLLRSSPVLLTVAALVGGCGASPGAASDALEHSAAPSSGRSTAVTTGGSDLSLAASKPVVERYVTSLIERDGAGTCVLMTSALARYYEVALPRLGGGRSHVVCAHSVLLDQKSRRGARLLRFRGTKRDGVFLGVQAEVRLPDRVGGATGSVWFWLTRERGQVRVARDGNLPGLFNGGNYSAAEQMTPTLPGAATRPWRAPGVKQPCRGESISKGTPANDVTASNKKHRANAPWLDIGKVTFYLGTDPCIEVQLHAPLRPDTRITVTKDRGGGTGGEAFELIVGGDKQNFSASGLRFAVPDKAGWGEYQNTLVFHPDSTMSYDEIRNFTFCVTSTAMFEPYLPWSGAIGDALPYDHAPC
jgi:hypothetical protein